MVFANKVFFFIQPHCIHEYSSINIFYSWKIVLLKLFEMFESFALQKIYLCNLLKNLNLQIAVYDSWKNKKINRNQTIANPQIFDVNQGIIAGFGIYAPFLCGDKKFLIKLRILAMILVITIFKSTQIRWVTYLLNC